MAFLIPLFIMLAGGTAAWGEELDFSEALAMDDQCADSETCALQALQRKTSKLASNSSDDPAALSASTIVTDTASNSACLCVFDIDRTLTQKQAGLKSCTGGQAVPGIYDSAYGGGTLVLSQLAATGINNTFCGQCFLGICSHGDAGGNGSKERDFLASNVLVDSSQLEFSQQVVVSALSWSEGFAVQSPLIAKVKDGQKHLAVASMVQWYQLHGVNIPSSSVYFFDDKLENVAPFSTTSMNAKQISCGSRDMSIEHGAVGLCGARADEITEFSGVQPCQHSANRHPPNP